MPPDLWTLLWEMTSYVFFFYQKAPINVGRIIKGFGFMGVL